MNTHSDRRSWRAAGLCALAGAWVFWVLGNSTQGYIHTASLFWWWSFQWVNPESESEHGILVLGISAWLFYRNLGMAGADGEGWSWRACAAMVAGLAIHCLGFVAQQARVSIVGLLAFAWGAATLGGGRRWGRAAAFPLAFLIFAIPSNTLDSFGFWLRMWVVSASAWISHLVGIDVIRNGTLLVAPDGRYNYDVAAACSGVRSLTALAALGMLVGYLRFRLWGVRLAFLALCGPLVLGGNIARVFSIVLAAKVGGPAWGDRAHEVMGYGVFAIVLGGLFVAAEMLARRRPDLVAEPMPGGGDLRLSAAGPWIPAAVTLAAALAAAAFLSHAARSPNRGTAGIALKSDGVTPVDLPVFLDSDWMGQEAVVTEVERQILPADTGFSRKNYLSMSGASRSVFLSIVLSGRDRTSIHRPELCLVGQGWTINDSFKHMFIYPGAGEIPARVLRVTNRAARSQGRSVEVRRLVAYYFVGGDEVVADHWQRIVHDAWNRVVHGRADRWAYVLMDTDASDGDEAALGRLQSVLAAALPTFEPRR
jgi:EpsI family protein